MRGYGAKSNRQILLLWIERDASRVNVHQIFINSTNHRQWARRRNGRVGEGYLLSIYQLINSRSSIRTHVHIVQAHTYLFSIGLQTKTEKQNKNEKTRWNSFHWTVRLGLFFVIDLPSLLQLNQSISILCSIYITQTHSNRTHSQEKTNKQTKKKMEKNCNFIAL